MEIRPCRDCRRLFNYLSGIQLCPDCRERQEDKFQEVRCFLDEHPGAGVQQIAECCAADEIQVVQWIRDGRLNLVNDLDPFVRCEHCGEVIKSGRYCERCRREFLVELRQMEAGLRKPDPETVKHDKEGPRMRFMRR